MTIDCRTVLEKAAKAVMATIVDLFRQTSFDPDTIKTLREAYDRALRSLHDAGQPDIVKEIIAQRIIALAKQGERNPDRLCSDALSALGNKRVMEK